MKSPEVYAVLREELSPLLKSLGFKRERSLLSWSRQTDGRHTVMWCQVSRDGWDGYAGSQFVVEFQRSESPEAGAHSSTRARLAEFLTDDQRAEVWRLQNRVIASLTRPPPTYPILHIASEVTRLYLEKFEPLHRPFGLGEDLWLRYAKPEHVRMWADFLSRVAPLCFESIETGRLAA